MTTDHNEAMRLADALLMGEAMIPEIDLPEAAALLRKQAERIAELERLSTGLSTVYNEAMDSLRIAVDERDTLRAEVERLRVDAEQWQAHKEVLKASHLDESLTIRMTMRHKGLNVEREGVLTMLAADSAIAGGDEVAAHMAGRYFNEMKSAIDTARKATQ